MSETEHIIHHQDARSLSPLPDNSIDLVVTSPPYPMIELWDDLFATLNPDIEHQLETNNGDKAFETMHTVLDSVWENLQRVVSPGGIVCINIGNATRTLGDDFATYPNAARITTALHNLGFTPLPTILWHKPTNKLTKFMGSGMIPPNAYPTLEHEHILIFRNGSCRSFEPYAKRRYNAAYFQEERNQWFTDIWTDIRGTTQSLTHGTASDTREQSGAYPVEIPARLIHMFSTYDDTILDPFWGTGTTSLAALLGGRNSIGFELNPDLYSEFTMTFDTLPERSREWNNRRLSEHYQHTQQADSDFKYTNTPYQIPVKTTHETELQLRTVTDVNCSGTTVTGVHEPHQWTPPDSC